MKYLLKYASCDCSPNSVWTYELINGDGSLVWSECFGEDEERLLQCVPKLLGRLRECKDLMNASFQDSHFLLPNQKIINCIEISGQSPTLRNNYWAAYVLFSSFYLHFSESGNSYSIIKLYTAWQSYNLIKILDINSSGSDRLGYEFASIYSALANLLADEKNSYSCRILWREKQEENQEGNDAQLRQGLRLSMFLQSNPYNDIEGAGYQKPLAAPGCFQKNRETLWQDITLHQRFQGESGKIAVQRFVDTDLLPRYDLKAALFLISNLRKPGKFGRRLIPLITLVAFIAMLFVLIQDVCNWQYRNWSLTITLAVSLLIIPLSLIFFGVRSSIALLLPRVAGGIAIGYFPLLIATEPWYLVVSALTNKSIWLLEWVSVLLIVWGYLYREVYPLIISKSEAIWRSFKVTVWATVQAVFIGFLLILFSTPVYRQLNIKPSGTVEDALSADMIPILLINKQFPLAALLTFAPISLLLGIILQILWEEKPITASVWLPESR